MEYKYCEKSNFEDFSSGRVLYGSAGVPNFPVRLINEIYRRCLAYSPKKTDITVYDCCCGSGYSLSVLGLCNQKSIKMIYGSDIDADMVALAKKNLALLTYAGMDQRKKELEILYHTYHKDSHAEALASAEKLKKTLEKEIEATVFKADATKEIPLSGFIDIIVTDIPYGNLVNWNEDSDEKSLENMISQINKIAKEDTIIAVSMNKKQKIKNCEWVRLERNIIGKRVIEIFKVNY